MKGKVLFVVGLGVGYVLGTRAGRRRYEQIKSAWLHVWESPAVQKQVHSAQDYAADRIGDLGSLVTENIKRAVTKPRESKAGESNSGDSNPGGSRSRDSAGQGEASAGTVGGQDAGAASSSEAATAGSVEMRPGATKAGRAKPNSSKKSGTPGSGGRAS